ncbi:MAG: lipid A deacylase LpxR family protein [Planctomycetota bacterium]
MNARARARLSLSVLLAAVAAACTAPAPAPGPRLESRTAIALTFDNDVFTGSDNNYTNGFSIAAMTGPVRSESPDSLPRRWGKAWSFLPFIDSERGDVYVGAAIGQEIFTPEDITVANPPPTEQPYAGVLFADFTFAGRGANQCSAWKLRVGMVGPESQAAEVQTKAHEIIDDDRPQGWDTQLPTEPILNLDYNLVQEIPLVRGDGLGARIIPTAGVSVGNYFTGGGLAAHAEVGWNLPDTVGAISLRNGIDPIGLIAATRKTAPSLSLFAGGGAFLVGHYLPLDGTVFRDSPSVDSEPVVGFLSAGASVRAGSFALSYLLSFFSQRYATEQTNDDFGRVTLSWSF